MIASRSRTMHHQCFQRLGIMRMSWQVFHDKLLLGRCFQGCAVAVLEYCSAVWCSWEHHICDVNCLLQLWCQLSTTCRNVTEVAQWATPSCSRPQAVTYNGVRYGRLNWLATPSIRMGSTPCATRAQYKLVQPLPVIDPATFTKRCIHLAYVHGHWVGVFESDIAHLWLYYVLPRASPVYVSNLVPGVAKAVFVTLGGCTCPCLCIALCDCTCLMSLCHTWWLHLLLSLCDTWWLHCLCPCVTLGDCTAPVRASHLVTALAPVPVSHLVTEHASVLVSHVVTAIVHVLVTHLVTALASVLVSHLVTALPLSLWHIWWLHLLLPLCHTWWLHLPLSLCYSWGLHLPLSLCHTWWLHLLLSLCHTWWLHLPLYLYHTWWLHLQLSLCHTLWLHLPPSLCHTWWLHLPLSLYPVQLCYISSLFHLIFHNFCLPV